MVVWLLGRRPDELTLPFELTFDISKTSIYVLDQDFLYDEFTLPLSNIADAAGSTGKLVRFRAQVSAVALTPEGLLLTVSFSRSCWCSKAYLWW